ncbi:MULTISPECIES: hypothetical protein [Eikenella]|uniref:Uncharacterized protein n=1 Tax=Eikenella longinqua TaxID=1795827 RepID=A0A1A9S1M1_9NEIS|nr:MULTISPECIES: hypothetical protein [Eikenella]OAM30844.1 hypothetical protein A7P95_02255 [Eikenella longinqua]
MKTIKPDKNPAITDASCLTKYVAERIPKLDQSIKGRFPEKNAVFILELSENTSTGDFYGYLFNRYSGKIYRFAYEANELLVLEMKPMF